MFYEHSTIKMVDQRYQRHINHSTLYINIEVNYLPLTDALVSSLCCPIYRGD
jgi:hypothetical protein